MRAILTAVVLTALALPARAADINDVVKFSSHLKTLKFGGDLRLRNDGELRRSRTKPEKTDRNRFRYRLRTGMELELPNELVAMVRLGAGTGEQFSNNQSFDNLSGQKQIFVDQAFLRWQPQVGDSLMLRLTGGKATNWLWRAYSSDLVWDDDFNPEGFQQSVEWLAPLGVSVFANALQLVADEDSNNSKNQWLFSQQLGAEIKLPLDSRIRTAAAYHKWSDENRSDFGQVGLNEGNRRGPGNTLQNRFGVAEWTSQVSSWIGRLPVRAEVTLARNLRARGDRDGRAGSLTGPAARDGYQFGVILGRAKKRGDWEAGLFKKYSQTDVTVADVADSDFGAGGTNRVGGIGWLTYSLQDWMTARAKYLTTKVIDTQFAPGQNDINRFQLDLQLSF